MLYEVGNIPLNLEYEVLMFIGFVMSLAIFLLALSKLEVEKDEKI